MPFVARIIQSNRPVLDCIAAIQQTHPTMQCSAKQFILFRATKKLERKRNSQLQANKERRFSQIASCVQATAVSLMCQFKLARAGLMLRWIENNLLWHSIARYKLNAGLLFSHNKLDKFYQKKRTICVKNLKSVCRRKLFQLRN